jgi:hypothetical protein
MHCLLAANTEVNNQIIKILNCNKDENNNFSNIRTEYTLIHCLQLRIIRQEQLGTK